MIEHIQHTAAAGAYLHDPLLFPRHALEHLMQQDVEFDVAKQALSDMETMLGAAALQGNLVVYSLLRDQFETEHEEIMGIALIHVFTGLEHAGHVSEAQAYEASFQRGFEAFLPQGIDDGDASRIRTLFDAAGRMETGICAEDRTIAYDARRLLAEALIGKSYNNEMLKGIVFDRMFDAAHWISGLGRGEGVRTVDPALVFRLNPQLMKYSAQQIEGAVTKLQRSTNVSTDTLLVKGPKAIYLTIESPERMAKQLAELHDMGILRHVKKRPDILNYPPYVLRHKEREYHRMGIPMSVIMSEPKFYIYETETIAGRINAFRGLLRSMSAYMDPEDGDIMRAELLLQPRILIDCGRPKIKRVASLISTYAKPGQWQDAKDSAASHARSPQTSMMMAFARTNPDNIEAAMSEDPQQNIFELVRRLVNEKKKTRRIASVPAVDEVRET